MRVHLILIAIFFAIGYSSCITDGENNSELWSITAGEKLPDFTVTMSDGRIISREDLSEKTAVIILFNTDCGDCRRELPILQKSYEETSDDAVWIAIAREEDGSSIAKFWTDNHLTIPYSPQSDRAVYSLFANSGIPRLYISDNQIVKFAFGPDNVPNARQLTDIIRGNKQ